jgi:tRNA(Ile)-lysidine synthase
VGAERPPRAAVRASVRAALADLGPGDRVLVALSGGPDSLALLGAAVRVAAEQGLVCAAVVVDHRLQEGSAGIALRAAEQARILGCSDVAVVSVAVPRGAGTGGLEAAARTSRYAALRRVAGDPPAAAVLLGHTLDDQAETVLLGLARGSGTRSLAAMAPRSGMFRRPLLDLPRALVAAAAADAAAEDPLLEPWSDPHNADPAFARVRVRRDVLPVLEAALGPGVPEALARTARLARADADALDGWAERVWADRVRPVLAVLPPGSANASAQERTPVRGWGGLGAAGVEGAEVGRAVVGAPPGPADPVLALLVPAAVLRGDAEGPFPPAITSRLVHRLLREGGCPAGALTAEHVQRVVGLLERPPGTADVALPGRRHARREGADLVVRA